MSGNIDLTDLNLTTRQLAVIKLIIQGKTNKEISQELSISENTVKAHLSSAMRKIPRSTDLV